MKTYFDCIPCFIHQALKAVRLLTNDESVQEDVMRQILHLADNLDLSASPPAMGREIHRVIREITGNSDPFKSIKEQSNQIALKYYPLLKERIEQSDDPFVTAVRVAIAGNIIDFAKLDRLDEAIIQKAINDSFTAHLSRDELNAFRRNITQAQNILYLGDNAGEIVFDRLLIEQMPVAKIIYAVRGYPVINDVTRQDAVVAGLADMVEIIDSGADVPGTILETCSVEFQERFKKADLIVAKGQGNYETLNDVAQNIYFLLKVKCPVVAADTQSDVGALVLQKAVPRELSQGVAS
ncbi:MAG: DUF89 family protein [Sedimentisphaerales bacterium]|nr:DUF89 family protein [Sedimentisphaerales bacterium]